MLYIRETMKPRSLRGPIAVRTGFVLALLIGLGAIGSVFAQELVDTGIDPRIRMEIEYARALKRWGLPDYAMIVLDRIRGEDPKVAFWIKLIELESLIAIGKFDEATRIVANEPDQQSEEVWGMKLSLADGYFAWGRYSEAQGIYETLFKAYPDGPPKDLNDFYMNSAYKYSQMLLLMGREPAALEAYRNVLKAKLPQHVERQVLSEMAELMVKLVQETEDKAQREKYFEEIEELTTEILWQQDVWFGKAIVILAHKRVIQGDIKGAQDLIDDYKDQLRQIDDILKQQEEETGEPLSKLSPMAQCRYLLGVMLQEEAEKILAGDGDPEAAITMLAGEKTQEGKRKPNGALQHFLNVFLGYPETKWAPDAGVRARQVERILVDRFGAQIKTNVDEEKMERVRRAQFQNARTLFNQQQFANAAESYVKVLNLFPEGEQSVSALGELSRCYIELQEELFADLVTRYLAERFSKRDDLSNKAGDQLMRAAEMYGERNMLDRRDTVYNLYFDRFPDHPLVPAMLFRFGEQKFGEEDYSGALKFYTRIVENYADAKVYDESLNKITYCHNKLGNAVDYIKALDAFITYLEKQDQPGHRLINAKFREADAYRELGDKYLAAAYNRYAGLVKLLTEGDPARYAEGADDEKRNAEILQAAIFFKAMCLAGLKEPESKVTAYKKAAIGTLEDLLDRFPESQYAPAALSQIGTLQTVLGDAEQAGRTLRELKKQYPDSSEAKNVDFMLGMNLLKLDMRQQAVRVFKEMFAGSGQYSPAQILTAGQTLAEAGEYEIALDAFNKVLSTAGGDRALEEPALMGKGRVQIAIGRHAAGVETLEKLLEAYPKSGFTVDANLALSEAYSELGANEQDAQKRFELFNKAVKAMKEVRKFESTPGGLAESDVGIGRILTRKAKAEKQFGTAKRAAEYMNDAIATYQALILLGDPNDAGVRRQIEEAFKECIPLLLETERWKDVVENADQYLEMFPNGRYESDVRSWRNRAQVKLATSAAVAPAGEAGGAADETEPAP